MTKIILEGHLTPDTIDFEDGGLAMIGQPEWTIQGADENIFLRIQSWDESIVDNVMYDVKDSREQKANLSHKSMNSLIGKKIRVTIEIIEN